MRVISSVVVSNNRAVQSVGWNITRPLGSIRSVLESMDRYELDEIILLNALRGVSGQEDFGYLAELSESDIMTPLTLGGGIRSLQSFEDVYQHGLERVCLSSSVIDEDDLLLTAISQIIGKQGVVAYIPYLIVEGDYLVFHSENNSYKELSPTLISFIDKYCDEVVLHDVSVDGKKTNADYDLLLSKMSFNSAGVILSGGITIDDVLGIKEKYSDSISAIAIENCLSFYEQPLKMEL